MKFIKFYYKKIIFHKIKVNLIKLLTIKLF